jgi:hypothetical protein
MIKVYVLSKHVAFVDVDGRRIRPPMFTPLETVTARYPGCEIEQGLEMIGRDRYKVFTLTPAGTRKQAVVKPEPFKPEELLELLKDKLAHHDWAWALSDSYGVHQTAEKERREIQRLARQLGDEGASLVRQYESRCIWSIENYL